MTKFVYVCYCLVVLGIKPCMLYAQCTLRFIDDSGDWHDPRSWDKWKVPTANDNVIIPLHGHAFIGNTNATCRTITVESGGSVERNGTGTLTVTNAANTGNCNYKRVFITLLSALGNMGGLAGADNRCLYDMSVAYITGTFKVWLSSTTVSASARLTHHTGPYVRSDGIIVANNWTDLTDGSLIAPINRFVLGSDCIGCLAWTNTNPDGTVYSTSTNNTCNNWTNDSFMGFTGRVGDVNAINGQWTSHTTKSCDWEASLYCIEQ